LGSLNRLYPPIHPKKGEESKIVFGLSGLVVYKTTSIKSFLNGKDHIDGNDPEITIY
jgi:hypothetical protein